MTTVAALMKCLASPPPASTVMMESCWIHRRRLNPEAEQAITQFLRTEHMLVKMMRSCDMHQKMNNRRRRRRPGLMI